MGRAAVYLAGQPGKLRQCAAGLRGSAWGQVTQEVPHKRNAEHELRKIRLSEGLNLIGKIRA